MSSYTILATISANYCTSPSFEETNWKEILSLYDSLLKLTDTPIIRLNLSVAVAKVLGNATAISELEELGKQSNIVDSHLFHSTLAALYKEEEKIGKAQQSYQKAISLTKSMQDKDLLQKKLNNTVPL